MKTPFTALWLILLTIIMVPVSAHAQWLPGQGLDGGDATDVAVLDTTLFVCADGIVSRNMAGGPWTQHLQSTSVSRINRCGEALFTWGYVSCYRSLDHGNSWLNMQSQWNNEVVFSLCTVDSTLFFTTPEHVFRSDDLGNTIFPVFTFPGYVYPTVSSGGGPSLFWYQTMPGPDCLYESSDKGLTYDTIPLAGLPANIGFGPVCRMGGIIWLSTTAGTYMRNDLLPQWTLKCPESFSRMEILEGVLTAGSSQGVFRLDTLLNQWFPENSGLETLDVRGLVSNNGVLYLATAFGPFKTSGLYNWQPFYDGLNKSDVRTLALHNNEVWAVIPRGTFVSEDEGATFTQHFMTGMGDPEMLIMTDSVFYAVAIDSFYVSNDHGSSWALHQEGLMPPPQWPFLDLTSLVIQGDHLFLGTNDGLYTSPVQNIQWTKLNSFTNPVPRRIDLFSDANTLIAVNQMYINDYQFHSFRSTNGGATFDSMSLPISSPLVFAGDGPELYSLSRNSLFKSIDEGISWNSIPIGNPEIYGFFLTASEPALIVGGSELQITLTDIYLAVTYDDGVSWSDISGNLPVPSWPILKQVAINQQRTFAAPSMNGLWYQDGLLTSTDDHSAIPEASMKIVPNPSSDAATLVLNFPEATEGRVTITGMMGNIIYEAKKRTFSKGSHHERIDINNFAAGLYLVTLETGQKKLICKLLVFR